MKYFTLFKKGDVHPAPESKIIPASEFSELMDAKKLLEEAKNEAIEYRKEVAKECEVLREETEKAGFEEGLRRWNAHIAKLEEETKRLRKEMEESLVPLALTAVKKIIGREIEIRPDIIVDIIATALRSVSQRHRITVNVHPEDLKFIEENRPRLKDIFEHLQSLTIVPRDDVERGGCIIETEAGIVNAQLSNQLQALEAAFHSFFQNESRGS